MTRAQVIEALQAHARGEGPAVETQNAANEWQAMRWDATHGPQYCCCGEWKVDLLEMDYDYRIVEPKAEPRTFLRRWVEVATFEEAEPSGFAGKASSGTFYGNGRSLNTSGDSRMAVYHDPLDGGQFLVSRVRCRLSDRDYWVKRIEAAPAANLGDVFRKAADEMLNRPVDERTHYGVCSETRDQLIKRLAPGYEDCTREEAEVFEAIYFGLRRERDGGEWHFGQIYNVEPEYEHIWLRKKRLTRDELKASQPGRNLIVTGLAEKPQSPAGVPVKEVGDLLYKAPEVVHEAVAQLVEKYGGGK